MGAVVLVGAFQTGRQVHRAAHHGVIEPVYRPHVAHDDLPGIEADAMTHFLNQFVFVFVGPLLAHIRQLFLHVNGDQAGPGGMIFIGYGGAEESDDGVAFVFVHRAAVVHDDVAHGGKVHVEHLNQLIRGELLGKGGESRHVRKKGGQIPFFAPQLQ